MRRELFIYVLTLCAVVGCLCKSADDWKSRTIYQILTDRFSPTVDTTQPCANISTYCGGSWAGITNHLDYIQGMGFNAIWISPVVTNVEGGYHGYWAQDFYTLNSNFGSDSDLIALVSACHDRDIWVMLDVVANHVGPVGYNYASIVPFNSSAYYHDCTTCPAGCDISDFNNYPQVEHCRLSGLPDLNQTNPLVSQLLLNWATQVIEKYGFDGLRVDTVPEVPTTFWKTFQATVGMYSVGEVYNGDVQYVASYEGVLDGVLSYPLFFTLRSVFANQQSLYNLQQTLQQYNNSFSNLDLLGTFIDNHDQPRFLNEQQDVAIYKNAITYTLMAQGIPIIYYGTEQEFHGSSDPNNREPLWTSDFNTAAPLYQFIATINAFRNKVMPWLYPQIQRYADDVFYAFSRGNIFVAMTNGGSSQTEISRTITYHPYQNGQKLCNLFYATDCVLVQNNTFIVDLDNGESKIFYPAS